MAFTLSQLEAVEAAIGSGTLTVRMGDRLVTYQSLSDLIKLRDLMRGELGVDVPAAARGRAWQPVTSSGL